MKRRKGETTVHLNRRIYMTRTASIFKHQRELISAGKVPIPDESRDGVVTLQVIRSLVINAIGVPCLYCGEPVTHRNFSLDHKIPSSRGGGLIPRNAQTICLRCNQTKGKLTGDEFCGLLDLIRQWDSEATQDVLRRLRAGSKALGRMFWKGKGKPGPSAPPA